MHWSKTQTLLIFTAIIACCGPVLAQAPRDAKIEFNRDIRPILSNHCFVCHGPDQSSPLAADTDLRLDQRDLAVDAGIFDFESPHDSELIRRVKSRDAGDQMPPQDSHQTVCSEEEIDRLQRWIAAGAPYQKHWAYLPPSRPEPPTQQFAGTDHPIDAFVRQKLADQPLAPSPPASREVLIRRATLDLTGLPPTPKQVKSFLNDPAPTTKAFERVVDRLLDSPQFGEHMARHWLDAARYADTSGYQYDFEREQWVWRDWVIHAFNSGMPYDDFVVQQIAGDLIPDADPQSRLATGFNRNHPITIEGGVVDEEYRTEYVIDRAVTTSTVFLGQTMICARCHDHKYDPISQEDFYRFYAFFNNVPERGLNGFDPKEKIPSPLAAKAIELAEARYREAKQKLLTADLPIDDWIERAQAERSVDWQNANLSQIETTAGSQHEQLDDKSIRFFGTTPTEEDYQLTLQASEEPIAAIRIQAITDSNLDGKTGRSKNGNFVVSEFQVARMDAEGQLTPIKIKSVEADFEQDGYPADASIDGQVNRSGWAVAGHLKQEDRSIVLTLEQPVPPDSKIRLTIAQRFGQQHLIGRLRVTTTSRPGIPAAVASLLDDPKKDWTDQQRMDWLRWSIQQFGDADQRTLLQVFLESEESKRRANQFPATMVMKEREQPRTAYVLERGEYDKPRMEQPLEPGIPAALGDLGERPANRLGLAQWLVSPEQPLTARVTVNRFWQQLFGRGLVPTTEDFGSQGAFPTHPVLLDWLATEFMSSGWDTKQLFKTIMMSQTYQQSSSVSAEAYQVDPQNIWLSRGPRVRMDAETIRDTALAVSGLLDAAVGGPSVYPYHPEGLWMEINNRPNFSRAYPHSVEPNQLYRRSVYTFWKRAVPPPSMATFDAPSREYCVVNRSRTNTPLQAFVMLHDPQFVEAARSLAELTLRRSDETFEQRLDWLFLRCLSRSPSDREIEILKNEFEQQREKFADDADAAVRLLNIGQRENSSDQNPTELASWTQIARLVMNLSEFITRH